MRLLSLMLLFDCCTLVAAAPPQCPMPPQAPAARPLCVCGDTCKCEAGRCPTGCPTAQPSVESNHDLWLIDGRFVYLPKGQKPAAFAPQFQPFTQPGFGGFGGCAGGSCGGGR